jgi:hypothetical protein
MKADREMAWIAKGYLEKLGFSFKVKACSKFYHRDVADIPRIKF